MMNHLEKLKANDDKSFPKIGLSLTCPEDYAVILERYCVGVLKIFEFSRTSFTGQDVWEIWKPDESDDTIDKKFEEQFGVKIDAAIKDPPMDDAAVDSKDNQDKDKVKKSEAIDVDADGLANTKIFKGSEIGKVGQDADKEYMGIKLTYTNRWGNDTFSSYMDDNQLENPIASPGTAFPSGLN